jgi:two-component system sensor kinase FixL
MHMRWVMVGLGVLHLVRMQGALTGWGVQTFGQDAWTLGIWSAIFVFGMLRYFTYIAMRIQQQDDERLQVAAALAREEEARRLSSQLARLERQQSLGVMSASFAHELNQPLLTILNYAELLQHRHRSGQADEKNTLDVLGNIVASSLRAADIVRRIRLFIQPTELKTQRMDMRKVVDEVSALVAHEAGRNSIQWCQDPMPKPIWVNADPVQMSQVLFNVVRNAMESVVSGDLRQIRLTLEQHEKEVQLRVYDTGAGLSQEAASQAGDPFFTTKISGLGMGLSISKTILAQFGGRLSLTNTPEGACALMGLPAALAS